MAFFDRFRRKAGPGHVSLTDEQRAESFVVPYLLAQDLPEHNRLDFQHFFLKNVLHANYMAPVENPTTILDAGSGTGRWAAEVAESWPQARVTGVDVQPSTSSAPLNARFIKHDILQGLPFEDNSFDYVHSRLLVLAIPASSWPKLIGEYLRVTRPGGWIEFFEGGMTFLNAGPNTQQFLQWWDQLSERRGIRPTLIEQLPELAEAAGLRQITTRRLQVPVGNWGGRVGSMLSANILNGWGAVKEMFATQLNVPAELFERTHETLIYEWAQSKTQYEYMIVYGQK